MKKRKEKNKEKKKKKREKEKLLHLLSKICFRDLDTSDPKLQTFFFF